MPNYDVAIVGAGLAGLTAAARLSHAGKRVVLTDPSERAGGTMATLEREGFRFSSAPNIAYGLEPGGPFQTLFADLGMTLENPSREARYQVALPDHRVTISPVAAETLDELRREFPGEVDQIIKLYRDAGTMSQKAKQGRLFSWVLRQRTAAAFLHSYRLSNEVLTYLDLQSRYFFGQAVRILPLASLLLLLNAPPRYFPEDLERIADQLFVVITGGQGNLMMHEPWPEMLLRKNRAVGIRTSTQAIESRFVIVNIPRVPVEQSIFFGIGEEVIPVKMEPTVIALADYAHPEDMTVLSFSPSSSSGRAPAGMRTLTASFYGLSAAGSSPEALRERARSIVPFLSDFTAITVAQDIRARLLPLPEQAKFKNDPQGGLPSYPVASSIKSLYLLPDSSRALQQTLSAAHDMASLLG